MNIKILHILGDSKFGGGAVVVLRLAQRARQKGYEVAVLTTDKTFKKVLEENNIEVVDLDVIWRKIRPLKDLIGFFRLYFFLRKSRFNVVHTHTSKAGFVGRVASKLAGIPVIIHTVHGFAFHEESNFIELKLFAFLEKIASYFCDKIVTVSEFHRKWALELRICNEEKIVAIPNGISEERVVPKRSKDEILSELGVSQDEFIIMTMGRLAPQKGIEYLIKAIPVVRSQIRSSFRVLIVGDGPLRPYLEDLATELQVKEYVCFLGFRGDVGDLLSITDIVVLPSLWEGLSIALLEAMATGKPIITTSIGSNREVIENYVSGVMVPAKNQEALAEAILELHNDRNCAKRLGIEAYRRYKSYYTENQMLDSYMHVYESLYSSKVQER